jgi:hypothetical protein
MVETQRATLSAEAQSNEGVRVQVPGVSKSLTPDTFHKTPDTYSASPRLGGGMGFAY